ncbi:hypothetical protein Tco_1057101 [Tanacetum coccineum]|uniref:Uncharacterized protein n=1 Tax=Tanacetum coccineum TaxID=301880 RepID=A0ABQ5H580_9ASTR
MADLIFADSHNMVVYMEKSEDNADFAEIVNFLNASPIRYALTVSLTVYVSYIEQFWSTAKIKTINYETQIRAKVDGKTIVIIESSVRRDLHFNDEYGITCLTNTEIFENLQLMGYEKLSDKLTFYNSFFSPQWKYLIHTILQCLSSKSTAWNEFGTNIASAVICLAKKQKFNFSKLIFDGFYRLEKARKIFFRDCDTLVCYYADTITSSGGGPTTLVEDETVHEERGDSVERAATTATSLDAEQGSGDTIAQTRSERVSIPSYDSPLPGVSTPGSNEERIKLKELMDMCTKLPDKGRNEIDQDEGISCFQEDLETQGRYGHDIGVNTTSTSITTASINITTLEPVTTASAPVTTTGVSVSTAEPSTPPITTTPIEDEDLTIANPL